MLSTTLVLTLAAAAPLAPSDALERAVAAYETAQIEGDRQALEHLLADDYVLANSGGETENKSQFIADLVDPTYHLKPFSIIRPLKRTWSDGAIRGGLFHAEGTTGGKAFDACLRYVDVWRRDGSGWRVAYSQAARVADTDCRSES